MKLKNEESTNQALSISNQTSGQSAMWEDVIFHRLMYFTPMRAHSVWRHWTTGNRKRNAEARQVPFGTNAKRSICWDKRLSVLSYCTSDLRFPLKEIEFLKFAPISWYVPGAPWCIYTPIYISYMGMCRTLGYGFRAGLVWDAHWSRNGDQSDLNKLPVNIFLQ